MRVRITVRIIAAALSLGLPSAAQNSPAEIARREMIAQAERARQIGDHPRALELALRAGAVRWTTSLRVLAAQEHEALGHSLEALGLAMMCTRETEADAQMRNRERIAGICRAIASSAERRVGRLTIEVPAPPAGLRIRVADVEVERALWGSAYPVMPGLVVVDAEAPGYIGLHRGITIVAGTTGSLRIDLTQEPAAPGGSVVGRTPSMPRDDRGPRDIDGPGAAPWILAGAGAAILGTAAGLFAARNTAHDDRDAACDGGGCAPVAQTYDDRYGLFTTLTNVALGVGSAAVVSGVLWWVLARPHRSADHPSRIGWIVRPGQGGAMFEVGGHL